MAFDARQAVNEKLTQLWDELKRTKDKAHAEHMANAKAIAVLEDEIAGWLALIADDEKPAKKTASKK